MRRSISGLSVLFLMIFILTACTFYPNRSVLDPLPEIKQEKSGTVSNEKIIAQHTPISQQNESTENTVREQDISAPEEQSADREPADIPDSTTCEEIAKTDVDDQQNGNGMSPAGFNNGGSQTEEGKNGKQETVDDALAVLNQSQSLWEKGELDNALALLDEAYSLVLSVNGDPDISWQKDDLRFLIAKRIIEIYASRSNVAAGYKSELPLTVNADVEKEIKRFQKADRAFFLRSYRRSGMYRPMILEQIREAGLPEELSWLPLVESGFKIKALSRARALGLWQFIPSTGYKFGLKRDLWVDERMDVKKSTKAAIAYLKELHAIFGDWLTVLAAYNCGEGRVLRVISRQHMNYLDNFWDLYRQLPYETSRYVPRFIAAVRIIKNPEAYGFDLKNEPLDPAISCEAVTTRKSMKLSDIAHHLSITQDELLCINSELRYKITPSYEYSLNVPNGLESRLLAVADSIPTAKKPGGARIVRHKIRKGETLSVLARKYKSSVRAITKANHLSSKHSIRAGKWLKIPVGKSYRYYEEASSEPSKRIDQKDKPATYRVKKGDSLWGLARRFDTTVSEIRRNNNLRSSRLSVGQVLMIACARPVAEKTAQPDSAGNESYIVQKGDSLYYISKKFKVKMDTLLEVNKLSRNDILHPGQAIIIRE